MLMRVIYLSVALLLFSACGQGFSGDYQDAVGVKYSFQSNGKVTVHMLGTERIMPFTRDGNVVKIGNPQESGALTLTILEDGSLKGEGLMAMLHLKKVE